MSIRQDADTSARSKTIAKNTGALYLRMVVLMVVTLYTSRVVLRQLGIVDFGINNVVAGFVSILAFFTSGLSNATQRYLSLGIGQGNDGNTRLYFRQSLSLLLVFAVVLVVVAETLGLWLVYTQLSIPPERFGAAVWTYQFAIVSMVCSVLQVAFLSDIIANERMGMYAYIGLFEAFARLAIAYLLSIGTGDKLIFFAFLSAAVSVFTLGIYVVYTRRSFAECRMGWVWSSGLVREMLAFIGSTLFGCMAWSVGNQGMNVILNIFFGPVVNAARGIAVQVSAAIDRFSSSLITASAPQIIKSYAEHNSPYMIGIIEKVSKFSFFLSCTLALPILWQTGFILRVWLGEVPSYAIVFTQLMVADSLINVFAQPLTIAANATGHIRGVQIYGRCITLLSLPVGYGVLALSGDAVMAFYVILAADVLYWGYCLGCVHRLIGMEISHYLRGALGPSAVFFVAAMAVCWCVRQIVSPGGWGSVAVMTASSVVACVLIGYLLLSRAERQFVTDFVRRKTK